MKLIGQLAVSLVVLAVGTIAGVLVEQHRSERNERIRFLDHRIGSSEGIFSRPRIPGRQIEVSLDGQPIDNISQVDVALYNLSDRDFENVPVYVELEPRADPPVEVLSAFAVGAAGLAEAVEARSGLAPSRTAGAVRYGYTIKTANRLRDDEVFKASFFVLGAVAPEVSVSVDKKGVDTRPFSYSNLIEESWLDWFAPAGIVALVVAAYVGLLILMARLARKKAPEQEKKLVQNLVESMDEPETRNELGLSPDLDLTALALHVAKTMRRLQWESLPRLMRPFFRSLDPDKVSA